MESTTTQTTVTNQWELGEYAYWYLLWTTIIVAATIFLMRCVQNSHELDKAVIQSSDPIAAACATGVRREVSNQCLALMARGN